MFNTKVLVSGGALLTCVTLSPFLLKVITPVMAASSVAALLVLYCFIGADTTSLPGPTKHAFFGSLMDYIKNFERLPEYVLEETAKVNGATWAITTPKVAPIATAIVISTPENVQHVMKDNFTNYEKGDQFRAVFGDFLGTGIFVEDGPRWKHHRKVASHMFSKRLLTQGAAVAFDEAEALIERLRASNGKPVDLQDLFFRCTIDIFCEIAFDVRLECISQEEQHEFAQCFDRVQELSFRRFQNPLNSQAAWVWPLFGAERELRSKVKTMHAFCRKIIESKRRTADSGDELGPDLISRFLDRARDSGETITDKELIDIVLNFVIAGRDTTACWLSWTFFELSKRPDVVQKLREEVKAKIGEAPTCEDECLEEMGKLPYLHAVVSEVLRLHPSVPIEIKFAVDDDTLPDGTRVNGSDVLIFSPYAMGRDARHWKDPEMFEPSRWLTDTGSFSDASAFVFPAFNCGPRICLGKNLAYMEVKLLTTKLLGVFEFEQPEDGHDGSYFATITMPMNKGLPMKADVI
eukprot:TRINITY_DN38881_c0_g1_i2.p1 TRINITY_DN38881_c0_g1~~TRINITY_DN38881_c0_g1_i2.p1  ORF type:complete len:521 (-),score=115.10 TRINITY_DN38881_c0_g1_i2:153-1715(-)